MGIDLYQFNLRIEAKCQSAFQIHDFHASTSYTPISKNVVGENGEWQLSNGIARLKGTVVSTFGMQKQCVLRVALNYGARAGARRLQQNPHKFAYLTMKNSIFAPFARAFFIF